MSETRRAWMMTIAVVAIGAACGDGSGPQAAPRLALSPPWTSIEVGDSIIGDTLRVAFVSAAGAVVRADSVTWSSSDTSVARIDATGRVRTRRVGVTTIRGAVGTAAASQRLTVTDPVLVGAGDMGTCLPPNNQLTARLLDSLSGTVFTVGDNDYSDATPAPAYGVCFDSTWGRHTRRVRPAPGDDDLRDSSLDDYFDYFGAVAHGPTGAYSYDLGTWHVVVLNSAIPVDSAQVRWLRADLAAHPSLCTVAISHRPRFSSGNTGSSSGQAPVFQALYNAHAELMLNGNDHDYERFAPQAPDQTPDPDSGLVEIVVGTGGKSHGRINQPLASNSLVQNAATYGVLRLELHAASYDWKFVPVAGKTFTDAGSAACF
jgi:hypothetical protein